MDILKRPRRLRRTEALRALVRETKVTKDDLIYPVFVMEDGPEKEAIASMPGIFRYSLTGLLRHACEVAACGVRALLLFGLPAYKDEVGSGAYDDDGIVQQALRMLKRELPHLTLIADICLCEYTSHGHCGLVEHGEILNDETLELLARAAVSCARAGADIVAPSDMMDGHVAAIRQGLDDAGLIQTPIMSYSTKFASAFYGPFRDAAASAPVFGDRKTYQMDPANGREAVYETLLDLDEGCDFVMVKPALAYLDILWRVAEVSPVPVVTYQVSGEYAMIKAASAQGWLDERRIVLETLTSMKRAGADLIMTYFAPAVARWLDEAAE